MKKICYLSCALPGQAMRLAELLSALKQVAASFPEDALEGSQLAEGLRSLQVCRCMVQAPLCGSREGMELACREKIPLRPTESDQGEGLKLLEALLNLREEGVCELSFPKTPPILVPEQIGSVGTALVVVGREAEDTKDQVAVLECNLDDCSGEQLGFAMEQLFLAGAKDVYFIPITMKKNRPGILLSVICLPEEQEKMCGLLFRHTSTIGVRRRLLERTVMSREKGRISTKWGEVEIKTCKYGDFTKTTVEYESAKKLALEHATSLESIFRGTIQALES